MGVNKVFRFIQNKHPEFSFITHNTKYTARTQDSIKYHSNESLPRNVPFHLHHLGARDWPQATETKKSSSSINVALLLTKKAFKLVLIKRTCPSFQPAFFHMELLSHTSGKTSKQSLSLECWRKAKLPTQPAAAATGAAQAGAPTADRDTSTHPWAVQSRRVSHSLQKKRRLFPVKGGAISEGKGVPSADRWRPHSHDVHFKQSPANKLPVSKQCWLLNFDSQVVSFHAVNNEFLGVEPMFYSTNKHQEFLRKIVKGDQSSIP